MPKVGDEAQVAAGRAASLLSFLASLGWCHTGQSSSAAAPAHGGDGLKQNPEGFSINNLYQRYKATA